MTKRQEQWMEVGRVFEMLESERDTEARFLVSSGLCMAMYEVTERDGHYRCLSFVNDTSGWWCTVRTRESDLLRATFAYLMAAMTDAERDQIVEGL